MSTTNDTFSALSDPNRRLIVELLAVNGQLTAGQIYERFAVSPPAISQHLKVLKEANVVVMEKKAQQRIYQINPESLEEVKEWLKKLTDAHYENFKSSQKEDL